jgi:predicted ester cyclase
MSLIVHLKSAISAWNDGNLERYLDLYHPSIRLHGYTPEPMDKAQATAFYRSIYDNLSEQGLPAPALVIEDAFESADSLACRFTMRGRQTGPFMGVPPTGRPYVLPGITILHFSGETVVERWSMADMLGLLQQLGASRS